MKAQNLFATPKLLVAAVALAVLSACSETPLDPLPADDPVPGDSSLDPAADGTVKMVPFETSHTTLPGDPDGISCEPGQLVGTAVITEGNGTHLGRYTGEAFACLTATSPGTLFSTIAYFTLVAANGDEVSFDMDPENPQLWSVVSGPSGPVLESLGGFHVVGGTGRFEGATGYVTNFGSRELTDPTGAGFTTIRGTISSPGSIK